MCKGQSKSLGESSPIRQTVMDYTDCVSSQMPPTAFAKRAVDYAAPFPTQDSLLDQTGPLTWRRGFPRLVSNLCLRAERRAGPIRLLSWKQVVAEQKPTNMQWIYIIGIKSTDFCFPCLTLVEAWALNEPLGIIIIKLPLSWHQLDNICAPWHQILVKITM